MSFKAEFFNGSANIHIGTFHVSVHPDHFRSVQNESDRQKLFKNSVQHVVIELSSSCNRSCCFCPNVSGSRLSDQKFLSETIFNRVISDLELIDYDNTVYWHLYNEPLEALDILVSRISVARKALPNAVFSFNTNGDYLTLKTIEKLDAAGCNSIFVSVYQSNDSKWDDIEITNRVVAISDYLELKGKLRSFPGASTSIEGKIGDLTISVVGRNLSKVGYDRGGLVPELSINRTSPCLSPFTEFIVDHKGYVLPCCNVYTDNPEHLEYVVDKISFNTSIFNIYTSSVFHRWRKQVFKFDPTCGLCTGCSRGDIPSIKTIENKIVLENIVNTMELDSVASPLSH